MAHLYKLTGENGKAQKLFEEVLASKGKYTVAMLSEAQFGLGELNYFSGKFKEALKNYERALSDKSSTKLGYINYRIAWSHLNIGNSKQAKATLIKILQNPDLMSKINANGEPEFDLSFHQDVAKDLATFLARTTVGASEIELLLSLSPDDTRRENLYFLGTETARLGKKSESLLVWDTFLNSEHSTPFEKTDIALRLAQLNYDVGDQANSLEYYRESIELLKRNGCGKDEMDCNSLKARLRDYITNWNKNEKSKPSLNLLEAYSIYIDAFPSDEQMIYWAAGIAQFNKRFDTANKYFQMATLAKGVKDNIFQGSLLGAIESAEATNNPDKKIEAYNLYLKQNPKGDKVLDVLYQRAHTYYELKNYNQAAEEFNEIVTKFGKDKSSLPLKAADLAMDSLAILKDHSRLESWGKVYAGIFSGRRQEFTALSHLATINLAAAVLNSDGPSKSSLKKSHEAITKINLRLLKEQEKIQGLKIRLGLAEKLNDLNEIKTLSLSLLGEKSISNKERQQLKSKLAWAEEMTLNFASAYKLNLELIGDSKPRDKNALRLALLAELAQKNPDSHYKDFIKFSSSRRDANLIRIQLIQKSKQPWGQIERELNSLRSTPDLLADLLLKTHAKYRNLNQFTGLAKKAGIQGRPEIQAVVRIAFLDETAKLGKKIQQHRIQSHSQHLIGSSIKKRLELLSKMENQANLAIRSRDWVAQLVTIEWLNREYSRFTNDLISLPIPRNIKAADRAQYNKQMMTQMAPFKNKAAQYSKKASEFWANSENLLAIENSFKKADVNVRSLLRPEIRTIAGLAPSGIRNRLNKAQDFKVDRPSSSQIAKAWKELKADPFDVGAIKKLKALEEQKGSEASVAYLSTREALIKKGQAL
jgi:TolA-binding protein